MSAAGARLRMPGRNLRLGDRVSARVPTRAVSVGVALTVLLVALLLVAIGTGDVSISPARVVKSLLGFGEPGDDFIVLDLRLPRAVCGVLVGAALGVAGSMFQSLTRNPLGSPDVIGFQQGATAGALVVITVIGGSSASASVGALAGGVFTAVLVYALAFKRGGVSSYRLILIGIAVSAVAVAINHYLLSRARIEEAEEATRWLLGSLNGRDWDDVQPLAIALVVLGPLCVWAGRPLRALELGDDSAHGLGVDVERARFALVALAVGLVSVTTVAVGPVSFVALTAPQIARRLTRAASPPLASSALVGAIIVIGADVLSQRVVPSTPLPVGVATGLLGGAYLAWLLGNEWRSGRRG